MTGGGLRRQEGSFPGDTRDICPLLPLTGLVAVGCTPLHNIATAAQRVPSLINTKSPATISEADRIWELKGTGGK